MKKLITVFLFSLFAIILIVSVRGIPGNPTSQTVNNITWKDDGPFELSPERGRFALTLSIIEDKSFSFSIPIARFATPDLGFYNNKYVSLFAPGISFLIIPGYILGNYFGVGQVGSFLVISIFALLNTILLYFIIKRLGAHWSASLIAPGTFLFATPAFAYSVSLFQHHVSTFLILSSLYLVLRFKSLLSVAAIWFLCALSIPLDYPNLFLMAPIGLYALTGIINIEKISEEFRVRIKLLGILTFITVVFPLMFFMWFNKASYGNPFQFSGTVARIKDLDAFGRPINLDIDKKNKSLLNPVEKKQVEREKKKSAIGFFKTRELLNGFYIHFFSSERGILYFTPIMITSIIGAFLLYRKYKETTSVILGIVGMNILLYSMWDDPWGGWAFGSRYLIPTYAVLSIFIGYALSCLRKQWVFMILFSVLFIYSVGVNTIGALTTNRIPPFGEAQHLELATGKYERYSYDRNIEYLLSGGSKSFVYKTLGSNYVTALQYTYLVSAAIILLHMNLIIYLSFMTKGEKK